MRCDEGNEVGEQGENATDVDDTPAYTPPAIEVAGRLDEITLGSVTGTADSIASGNLA